MKAICVYHSRDLDGWVSAAIVCKRYPYIKLLGWDYGDDVPELKNYDTVIIVDVCFPMKEMIKIGKKTKMTWIDHHKSAIDEYKKILPKMDKPVFTAKLYLDRAACEITWGYYFPNSRIPETVRLLGSYDCFRHKGTVESQKVLAYQYYARSVAHDPETAKYFLSFDANLRKGVDIVGLKEGYAIYDYLCTEARQTYKKAFPITFIKYPTDLVNNSERKFLCVNKERFNPINFGIDYHKDGYDGFACFWFDGHIWTYSLYNDNGKVDVSAICKKYGGGGHKGAAGFTTKDVNKIISFVI